MPRLERVQLIRRPLAEVFDFFADAMNLEAITPPYLNFRILTPPPIAMQPGTLIDYRLQLFGIPFTWRTEIESFEPQVRFVDRQLRGPYALWQHLHEFEETEEGVRMLDRVDYRVGWSVLGTVAQATWVRRTLAGIFDYRCQKVAELLEGIHPGGGATH